VIKKEDISKVDKQDWDNYTKNPKDVFNKELESNNTIHKKKRYKFDLHGYTLIQANEKVKEIISACIKNNYKEILLITGKGIHSNTDRDVYSSSKMSKLRYSIPDYIKSQKDLTDSILKIIPADQKEGGDGALIIELK
jgi:DNA-nicking Smr family endonuclease|tara:strand:+ start:1004 stop:1417 length:414 start_codon:yes stop_codon:yes gene_type:complete